METVQGSDAVFSIGKFMKLCGTTRETLYHYEKLGLLKPTVDAGNGYRSYTPNDYYTFMFISHMTKIGFSLHEIEGVLTHQTLSNYFNAVEISRIRSEEKQAELKLWRDRTQLACKELKKMLGRPLDTPQIMYHEEEYFLKVPFNYSSPIVSDVECSAEQDDFARENNIDIQRYYHGYYSEKPFQSELPRLDYSLAKLYEPLDCDRLLIRPAGMYITMCYHGPFYGNCAPSYQIVKDYLKKHRFTPLTGMFVETAVTPFHTKEPDEYIAELSLQIE